MSDQTTRKENDMRARLTKLLAGLTAVAALAFGGAALAGAASNPSPPAPPPASAPADTAQQGDQTAPDKEGATENAAEAPSSDKAEATEPTESSSESATESASEVAGNDGPGGHADEPGNANADHQFQGQE
jgi:cytoskeletal protein RodZ